MGDLLQQAFCTDAPDETPQLCWGGLGASASGQACVSPDFDPMMYWYDPPPRMATTDIGLCGDHYEEILGVSPPNHRREVE